MSDFSDLLVYKKAFKPASDIYEISKRYPKEETYSLTDQIRRSSRSVCANFAEAYRRRKYPQHFLRKLSDSDAENAETSVWRAFAFSCNYITQEEYDRLYSQKEEVGKLIGYMIKNPTEYC